MRSFLVKRQIPTFFDQLNVKVTGELLLHRFDGYPFNS
jgi:hypothetical protein